MLLSVQYVSINNYSDLSVELKDCLPKILKWLNVTSLKAVIAKALLLIILKSKLIAGGDTIVPDFGEDDPVQ